MKKPSEIWDTPEATGFYRVVSKDIEEMRKQKFYQYLQVAGFHKEAEEWFTQHHEAEVERAVEKTNQKWLLAMDEEIDGMNAQGSVFEEMTERITKIALTPTKTDKQ